MKKITALLALLFLACVTCLVYATNYVLIGSMAGVNGTSNSPSILIGQVYPPRGTFYIQNGGIIATNAFLINVQMSIDGTNFFTVSTYYPNTNSVGVTNYTDTFSPAYSGIPIYLRAQAVTVGGTNVLLGGTYVQ